MTICSTCQGVMAQANERLREDEAYLAEVNADLAEEGLEYEGTVEPKHLLWILVEEVGIDNLRSMVVRPLEGFKVAPFYGCYIVRPSSALGFDEHPERQDSLEQVIEAVGAEVVDFPGKTLCCGFPIMTIKRDRRLQDGIQSHPGRQGPGGRRNGYSVSPVPSEPRRPSARRGRSAQDSHRPAHHSPPPACRAGSGHRPKGHAP